MIEPTPQMSVSWPGVCLMVGRRKGNHDRRHVLAAEERPPPPSLSLSLPLYWISVKWGGGMIG
jgi:hypothetical protein